MQGLPQITFAVLFTNFLVDILSIWLDPRDGAPLSNSIAEIVTRFLVGQPKVSCWNGYGNAVLCIAIVDVG